MYFVFSGFFGIAFIVIFHSENYENFEIYENRRYLETDAAKYAIFDEICKPFYENEIFSALFVTFQSAFLGYIASHHEGSSLR